ncbi:MAG: SIS domain-containing protein [Cellulomonas sp.]|uniref:SIS domain-containing protein n=1 Tax=Cellulomonas sp. TaxID=40001 RepID=UPI0019E22E65|nr:SIS domain-containing protein [Cellulomonas sp.]MBF0689414.1 SIS domain-containing protein [Cellulomonas sp.]
MTDQTIPGALMRAEVAEQPERWLDLAAAGVADAARLVREHGVDAVTFAARGTSDHAAVYGQYLVQTQLRIPAHLATPSMATLYQQDVTSPSTLVVALSQSGRSPDLVETVRSARRSGCPTLAITNDPSSPLATGADVHVPIRAGAERSVAATKSYTGELLALYLWVQELLGTPRDVVAARVAEVARAGRDLHERAQAWARRVALELWDTDRALVLGRGYGLATAREAALKLTETCGVAASGWSAADAKHGPLAQVMAGTPVFCLRGATVGRESVEALMPDVRARDARLWSTWAASEAGGDTGPDDFTLPSGVPDELVPLLEIIPFQLLALELSLARGLDPDRPRGLTKVTLTS